MSEFAVEFDKVSEQFSSLPKQWMQPDRDGYLLFNNQVRGFQVEQKKTGLKLVTLLAPGRPFPGTLSVPTVESFNITEV